jgi:methanogenic corrinoid protein MtbC1
MIEQTVKAFNEALFDTDREEALKVIRDAAEKGLPPEDVVFKVILPALELMVKAISESFDANLAQHFMTSQIAMEATEEMLGRFRTKPAVVGRAVIGTAQGDLHSLGKRIVMGCLRSFMVEAADLGVNVAPERFVEEAVALDARVIGISAMMVHTARGENGCLKVRQILRERGLEDRIKIVVGGAPYRYDSDLYKIVQADAWAEDGVTAGKIIADLVKGGEG